jgi:hypothetical protein
MTPDQMQRLSDEIAIRDVIYKSAMLQDSGRMAEYVNLFTEDGTWELKGEAPSPGLFPTQMRGRGMMLDVLQKLAAQKYIGPDSHRYHLKAQTVVTLAGDTASASTYGMVYVSSDSKPQLAGFRIYNDKLVRTADGWKIAERVLEPT